MMENCGISPDGKTCEKCGSALFNVIPGKTTQQEIIEFAREAEGWKENPDTIEGWMPSGIFCKNGCVAVHADYPPPWRPAKEPDENAPEYGVFIKSPGPRRVQLMLYLRKLNGLTHQQAKEVIDNPKMCVAIGKINELEDVVSTLENLGAEVSQRKYDGEEFYPGLITEVDFQPSLAADIFWNGLILFVFTGLVGGAVYYFRPENTLFKIAANILVLILGVTVLSIFGELMESRKHSEEMTFHPPFAAVFVFTTIGGVLTIFFGWHSTLAILGLCAVAVVFFGLRQ